MSEDRFDATNAVATAVNALRARARLQLAAGVDSSKVAYDLAHDARLSGVSDDDLRGIIDGLRREGVFPKDKRYVRVSDIKFDAEYRQRPVSTLVVRMAEEVVKMRNDGEGEPAAILTTHAPIRVNQRPDGEFYILDGWTRLRTLAMVEGADAEVPVEVEHMTREEEVREFIEANARARRTR